MACSSSSAGSSANLMKPRELSRALRDEEATRFIGPSHPRLSRFNVRHRTDLPYDWSLTSDPVTIFPPVSCLGEEGMSTAGEAFLRYANAEKELCEKAGAVLIHIITEIEDRYGIKIAELRVTMDPRRSANGWSAANCVMVREQQILVTDKDKTGRGPLAHRAA